LFQLVGPEADFRTFLQAEMAEKPPLDHLIVGVIVILEPGPFGFCGAVPGEASHLTIGGV